MSESATIDRTPNTFPIFGNRDIIARFNAKYRVDLATECWIWTGGISSNGYGQFWLDKKTVGAHVAAYTLFKDDIPKGLQLDHLCRIRCCVNPDHLEIVTCQVNVLRGFSPPARNATKETCKRGHIYDVKCGAEGYRACRQCRNVQKRDWARRARERLVDDLRI